MQLLEHNQNHPPGLKEQFLISISFLTNLRGSIDKAQLAVNDERFSAWFKTFLGARENYLNSRDSLKMISSWITKNENSMGHFKVPIGGFSSLKDFVTRELQTGVRPIFAANDPSILVSPADCTLWRDSTFLKEDDRLIIRKQKYNLISLLGTTSIAKKYENGEALVCFFDTGGYFRFHSPIEGKIAYLSNMNKLDFASKDFISHFHKRQRVSIEINVKNGKHLAISALSNSTINSVQLAIKSGENVSKGQELGMFNYGGTALVLLFEPGYLGNTTFDEAAERIRIRGTKMLMGQKLGNLNR